jgi:hypothetical protein
VLKCQNISTWPKRVLTAALEITVVLGNQFGDFCQSNDWDGGVFIGVVVSEPGQPHSPGRQGNLVYVDKLTVRW